MRKTIAQTSSPIKMVTKYKYTFDIRPSVHDERNVCDCCVIAWRTSEPFTQVARCHRIVCLSTRFCLLTDGKTAKKMKI